MNLHWLISPRSALVRLLIATVVGVITGVVLRLLNAPFPLLIGWNAAGLAMLSLAWNLIARCDPAATQKRAGVEDPGRSLVYGIVLLASVVTFFTALQLTRRVVSVSPEHMQLTTTLCLVSVTLAWAMAHTTFTLRYAHLYYREDDGVGGVSFPEDPHPTYFDFAYLAFTVGMCFQTSDVCITSATIRRTVLFHAIISFVYNTAIIAFVLNLVFGRVS